MAQQSEKKTQEHEELTEDARTVRLHVKPSLWNIDTTNQKLAFYGNVGDAIKYYEHERDCRVYLILSYCKKRQNGKCRYNHNYTLNEMIKNKNPNAKTFIDYFIYNINSYNDINIRLNYRARLITFDAMFNYNHHNWDKARDAFVEGVKTFENDFSVKQMVLFSQNYWNWSTLNHRYFHIIKAWDLSTDNPYIKEGRELTVQWKDCYTFINALHKMANRDIWYHRTYYMIRSVLPVWKDLLETQPEKTKDAKQYYEGIKYLQDKEEKWYKSQMHNRMLLKLEDMFWNPQQYQSEQCLKVPRWNAGMFSTLMQYDNSIFIDKFIL